MTPTILDPQTIEVINVAAIPEVHLQKMDVWLVRTKAILQTYLGPDNKTLWLDYNQYRTWFNSEFKNERNAS